MRSFVNMIFFILRLVFRLIWNLFWGLVETVVVLGLLIFGLLYYANHSQSAIANAILDVKDRVVTYVSTQDDDLVGCLNNLTIARVRTPVNLRQSRRKLSFLVTEQSLMFVKRKENVSQT